MISAAPLRRVLTWVFWIALAAGGLLASALIALFLKFHVLPFRGESFSPERWQDVWDCGSLGTADCALHRANCLRGSMVADLLNRHVIVGQTTRDEVRDQLGAGDWNATIWHDAIRYDQCQMHLLGMCSGFAIDYDSVFICLDDDGVVAATGHRQH